MKTTVYEKGKNGLAKAKRLATATAVGGALALSSALPVFAEDATAETAIVSGMQSAATSMTGLVTKAVPIVVPIMTAVIVVTFGMGLFKKLAGKAK